VKKRTAARLALNPNKRYFSHTEVTSSHIRLNTVRHTRMLLADSNFSCTDTQQSRQEFTRITVIIAGNRPAACRSLSSEETSSFPSVDIGELSGTLRGTTGDGANRIMGFPSAA
jgi:hypothetical protein